MELLAGIAARSRLVAQENYGGPYRRVESDQSSPWLESLTLETVEDADAVPEPGVYEIAPGTDDIPF